MRRMCGPIWSAPISAQSAVLSSARHLARRVWSDRYLSALKGDATIGLAIPFGDYVLLGEVAQILR